MEDDELKLWTQMVTLLQNYDITFYDLYQFAPRERQTLLLARSCAHKHTKARFEARRISQLCEASSKKAVIFSS